MKNRVAALAILVILFINLASSVKADITPPSPPSGSNILPGQTTQVRMMSETVIMDIQKSGAIRVEANFSMRNMSSDEESMDVYYPLNYASPENITDECWSNPGRKPDPIGDLSAWVDGIRKVVQTKYVRDPQTGAIETYIPCWATFPVVFPAGKDVKIRVTYTSQTSNYVLHTGAGWKDAIGRADIIVRFPYEINEINFLGCYYEMANRYGSDCQVIGKELHWYDENFEPDYDFDFSIVPADQWVNILNTTEQTRKSPEDAEAWGRLGLAYKTLLKRVDEKHPEIDEQGNEYPTVWFEFYYDRHMEIFRRSAEAYRKAVTLKPSDADWHYGYAELLCYRIIDLNYQGDFTQDAALCAREIKLALENKSGEHYQDALRLLKKAANAQGQELIDLSGAEPKYLVLTPQAAKSLTPTLTFTAPPLTETPTLTQFPIQTQTSTSTISVRPISVTPTVMGVQTISPESSDNGWVVGLVFTGVGLIILTMFMLMKRKS